MENEKKIIARDPLAADSESNTNETHDQPQFPKEIYGGFWKRTIAYLIDLIIISLASHIFYNLTIYRIWSPQLSSHWSVQVLSMLLFVAYFALTTHYLDGQTPGKIMLGLKVLKADGQPLDRFSLLSRETAGRLVIRIVPFIALFLVFSQKRQHLVDQLCDTVVLDLNQWDLYQK